MVLHVFVCLLVVCILLSLVPLWGHDWLNLRPSSPRGGAKRSSLPHLLNPRTPDDCAACRLDSPPSLGGGTVSEPVRPWCEVKSRRGAPKRIDTEGLACPNQQCQYFSITDARVHALVGDGKHGLAERIQTFRCQACRTTFSARRDTPLYRLKTPSHHIATVLSALAEALDPSAAERVFGDRQATITTWLTRAGQHAHTFHEHFSAISNFRTCSWTNSAPGSATPSRCSGSGWSSIPAPRSFPCSISVCARNTRLIPLSIPCERSWLLAVFRFSPAMA